VDVVVIRILKGRWKYGPGVWAKIGTNVVFRKKLECCDGCTERPIFRECNICPQAENFTFKMGKHFSLENGDFMRLRNDSIHVQNQHLITKKTSVCDTFRFQYPHPVISPMIRHGRKWEVMC
jgi:hypothetical protein